MSMKKVSIIVPMFNMEQYIKKCLDSLIGQSYTNIEIIIIDDGSIDSSAEICREYMEKDSRIVFVQQKNSGVSSATNQGLDIATGDFFMFVDSDDTIKKNAVELLVEHIEKEGYDIVQSGAMLIDIHGNILAEESFPSTELNTKEDIYNAYFEKKIIGGNLAQKIYKADIFQSIRMPEGRNIADVTTFAEIIQKCEKYLIIRDVLYIALKRGDSVSMSALTLKKYEDLRFFIEKLHSLSEENGGNLKRYFYIEELNAIIVCYVRVFQSKRIPNKSEILKQIRRLYIDRFTLSIIKKCKLTKRIRLVLFRLFSGLYAWLAVLGSPNI